MHYILQKLKTSALLFLELQLVISISLLPIFIAWGLPTSCMSILGNYIFAPLLTVFIINATLLWLTTILHIPNFILTQTLNIISKLWQTCLNYGTKNWLIGIPSKAFPAACVATCILVWVYIFFKPSQKQRILILCFLYAIPLCTKQILNLQNNTFTDLQKINFVYKQGKMYVIDYGALGSKRSYESWIDYTLIPYLIKTTGSLHIDMLILCKTNPRTMQAVDYLQTTLHLKNLLYLTKNQTVSFSAASNSPANEASTVRKSANN